MISNELPNLVKPAFREKPIDTITTLTPTCREEKMAAVTVYVDIDLKEIVPLFLESRQEDIANMRRAIAEGDFDKLVKIGHTLKGVGGGYGFDFITDLGREIEGAARDENSQIISKLVDTMEESLANVEIVYEE